MKAINNDLEVWQRLEAALVRSRSESTELHEKSPWGSLRRRLPDGSVNRPEGAEEPFGESEITV